MQSFDLFLKGLKVFIPNIHQDERGFFFESYRNCDFEIPFVQDNVSFSHYGVVRALHFQTTPGQDKLVSCLSGTIWDVAVDLRPDSATFMKWESVLLDDREHKMLFIPKGFAHGFCVLSPTAHVHYKVSSFYNPETEKSIRWNDPDLKIDWPIQAPILSLRDQTSPFFKEIAHVVAHGK